MANEFSTAGITVWACVETTAGTRPSSGFTKIAGIKSTPDMNPEPDSIEVTDLEDAEWRRFIPGLKSVGGALAFTANLTSAFVTTWVDLVEDAKTAREANKATWFEIAIPNFNSFYFAGYPSPLGAKAFNVGEVAEVDAYITPNQFEGWASASTK